MEQMWCCWCSFWEWCRVTLFLPHLHLRPALTYCSWPEALYLSPLDFTFQVQLLWSTSTPQLLDVFSREVHWGEMVPLRFPGGRRWLKLFVFQWLSGKQQVLHMEKLGRGHRKGLPKIAYSRLDDTTRNLRLFGVALKPGSEPLAHTHISFIVASKVPICPFSC